MKGYLHIGTPKTATTTLQDFLGLNRQKLLENGFINTTSAGGDNDFNLAVAALNPGRRNGLTNLNNITTDIELAAVQKKVVSNLAVEIGQLAKVTGDAGRAVFSSEYFQLQLTTREEIQRLKQVLHKIGIDEVDVIVYLRDPVGLATSYFSTGVKAGGDTTLPPHPSNGRYSHLCDHKNTVENFASVFGKSHIIPRIFDKSEFKNESIIDDFLQIIGADAGDNYTVPENSNESLSSQGVALLSRLNRIFPRWIGSSLNPLYSSLIRYMEKNYSNGTYAMPQELHELYVSYFEPSNEWVRNNYFPDRTTLFRSKAYRPGDACLNSDHELDDLSVVVAQQFLAEIKNTDMTVLIKSKKHLSPEYTGLDEADQAEKNKQIVHLSLAISQYHLKQYVEALASIETVLVVNAANTEAVIYKAMCLRELENYTESDRLFSSVIEKIPDNYTALVEFAVSADKRGDLPLAEARWAATLAKFPDLTDVLINTGTARYRSGNYQQALDCFDKVLLDDDENRNAIYRKSKCLTGLERFAEADTLLLHAQQVFPDYPPFFTLYAQISHFQKDWTEALKRWCLVDDHLPELPQTELGKGTCYFEQKKFSLAIDHFTGCRKLEPDNQLALLYSAKSHVEIGKLDTAETEFLSCQKQFPDSYPAFSGFANIAELQENWSEAVVRWEKVNTIFESNDKALFQAGECYRKATDYCAAMEKYSDVLAIEPNHKNAMLSMALCHKEMQQFIEAEEILLNAQAAHTNFLPVYFEYASIPAIQDDYTRAAARWHSVSKHFPEDSRAFLQSAIFYTRTDQLPLAVEQLDKLLAMQDDHQQGLLLKAQSLIALGHYTDADPILVKGQSLYPELEAFYTEHALVPVKREDWSEAAKRWSTVATRFPETALYRSRAGDYHKKNGNYPEAAVHLEKLLEIEPAHKNGSYSLAQCYKELGEYQKAEQILLDAASVHEDSISLHYEYANLSTHYDKDEVTASRWARVAEKFPDDTRALLQSALYHYKTDQFEQAQGQSERLLAIEPGHLQALLIQAQALVALERYALAEPTLIIGQKRHPEVTAFQTEYASIAVKQENWPVAAERWSLLAESDPENVLFRSRAGDYHKKNGNNSAAIEHLKVLTVLDPTQKNGFFSLAQCYKSLEQYDRAEETLLEAQTKHPEFVSVFYEYANLPTVKEDYGTAARRWEQVSTQFPEDVRALLQSAIYYYKTDQFELALDQTKKLLVVEPEHQQGLLVQAQVYIATKQYSLAEPILLVGQKRHPEVTAFQTEYASIAVKQENWSVAAERWSSLAESDPENVLFRSRAGDYHKKSGNNSAAIEHLKYLTALDPTQRNAFLSLAQCYKALGQNVEAEQTLLEAQAEHPDFVSAFYEYANLPAITEDFRLAASRWESVANQFPDDNRSLLQSAILFYKTNQFKLALKQSGKLLKIEPGHQQGLLLQAQALVALEQYADAEASLLEGQKHHPALVTFYSEYAQIAIKTENWSEAARRWAIAATKFPGNLQYELKAGDNYRKVDNHQSAAVHYKNLLAIDSDNKSGLLGLAMSQKMLNLYSDADVTLCQAQRAHPEFLVFHYEYANLPLLQEDESTAAARWQNVVKLFPTDDKALLQTGMLLSKTAQWDAVSTHLKKLLEINPEHQQAHLLYIRSLIAVDRYHDADNSLRNAQALFPSQTVFVTEYASIAVKQENWPEAAIRWAEAAEKFPENPHYQFTAGTVCKKAEQHQRAIACFNEVLKHEPKHQLALQNKALCLVELQRFDLAERVLEQLQFNFPDLQSARTEYAALATKQKNWSEAEKRWLQVSEKIPDSALAYFHTGFAQLNLRRYSDAINTIDKLLEIEPDHQPGMRIKAQCQVALESPDESGSTVKKNQVARA